MVGLMELLALRRVPVVGSNVMLPLQTGGAVSGNESDPAFPVDYLPMLRQVVEFDVAGPGDFEMAEFV